MTVLISEGRLIMREYGMHTIKADFGGIAEPGGFLAEAIIKVIVKKAPLS